MATLNIEGVGRVSVDDSFLKLSPEDQAKTVDEIIASTKSSKTPAPAPAPASKKPTFMEYLVEDLKGKAKTADDFVRGAADTLTFGYADEIAALGNTAVDSLMGRTKDKTLGDLVTGEDNTFAGRYAKNLADQRRYDAEAGAGRTVGQIGGGLIPVVKGAQLAKKGLDAAKAVVPFIPAGRAAVGAVTGGVGAGLYGAGSAEGDLTDRMASGAQAVPFGMAVGAVAPWAVEKVAKGGSAVVDKVKDIAGVKVPVEKLSPAAQNIVKQADEAVTEVTPKAAKALEKLSQDPKSIASDLRVRDLFTSEKARVLGADPQRAIPDDEVFKNVGDKLKSKALQTVDTLRKAGDIDADAAKELKAVVSRAARHNRAITGAIKDEELAAELSRGFKTDDSIIDALNIGRQAKTTIKEAIKDLDTVTYNSLKKNQGGIFQNIGSAVGGSVGQVGGTPGAMLGRQIGGGTGRIVDKVLLQQGTAPVLKRNVERLAAGLDEAGVKAGDTVKNLDNVAESALQKLAKKSQVEAKAKDLMAERLNTQNIALARARAPYAEGSRLGPNASPQAVLVEAFEDATGIKHKPGMVQDVLKALRKDDNLGPAFKDEVDQAIKALGNKPGRIDNLTNLVRAVRAKAAEQKALGTLKVRAGQVAEEGAGRIRNAERYNAKVIENTIRDVLGGTPPNPNQGALSAATKGAALPQGSKIVDADSVPLFRASKSTEVPISKGGKASLGEGGYFGIDSTEIKGYGGDVRGYQTSGKLIEVAGDAEYNTYRQLAMDEAKAKLDSYLADVKKGKALDPKVVARLADPSAAIKDYFESRGISGVLYKQVDKLNDHHSQVLVFDPKKVKLKGE